jgi:alkylation response protein AidB-like acyl-CoA dehydrogenase
MDFSVPPQAAQFRERLRELFASHEIRRELEQVAASPDGEGDPRPLYRILGREGVLAVTWPRRYGGAGRTGLELAVLQEEMVRAGIPDTLHINSVQIVGTFLLAAGSEAQREAFLPRIARGQLFASILYSEPGSGSDVTALRTRAHAVAGGYAIAGIKRFSLKSHLADYGLCLARTSDEPSRYLGLSLFMVPLDAPGVRMSRLTGIAAEAFHEIELDNVLVPGDALVGELGGAWPLLLQSLSFERTGVDYYARGQHWLDVIVAAAGPAHAGSAAFAERYARHRAAIEAGRWLALRALAANEDGRPSSALAAVAKWQCSEAAQQVAWWAVDELGTGAQHGPGRELWEQLAAAYAEAPGMTISAGASELLLEIVARSALDNLDAG